MILFEDHPLEKYILSVLKKNKHNVDLAYREVYAKYPFFKKYELKGIINEILSKKINKEKISGFWNKIEKKWKLSAFNDNDGDRDGAAAFSYSGPEMPASVDKSEIGNGLGKWTTTNGQPTAEVDPNKEETEDDIDDQELQTLYDDLFEEFSTYISDNQELNKILIQELVSRGYGNKVTRIKLKKNVEWYEMKILKGGKEKWLTKKK